MSTTQRSQQERQPLTDSEPTNERLKALELAIGKIEKELRPRLHHAPRRGHRAHDRRDDPHRLAGARHGAGRRRVPRGRITEIYGPEMAGKSTLAQHIIAQAQKLGGLAAYIDVEHAMDPDVRAAPSASTSRTSSSRSRTPASRRSRSARRSSARTRSMSSSSTPSRRSCRALRSRATWATRCPACRRG